MKMNNYSKMWMMRMERIIHVQCNLSCSNNKHYKFITISYQSFFSTNRFTYPSQDHPQIHPPLKDRSAGHAILHAIDVGADEILRCPTFRKSHKTDTNNQPNQLHWTRFGPTNQASPAKMHMTVITRTHTLDLTLQWPRPATVEIFVFHPCLFLAVTVIPIRVCYLSISGPVLLWDPGVISAPHLRCSSKRYIYAVK